MAYALSGHLAQSNMAMAIAMAMAMAMSKCQFQRVIATACLRLWVNSSQEAWFGPSLDAVSLCAGNPYRLIALWQVMTE
jgi:hypothetical protein